MSHRHFICIVVWLFAASVGVAWSPPLLAQTPTPALGQPCPPEEEWRQHMARPGDRWATIADQYGVSEADLRAANPTPLGLLRIGVPVRIPCVPGPGAPPYPTPRAASTAISSGNEAPALSTCTPPPGWDVRYTVQRGDTLNRLAAACRTTTAAIRQANSCRSGERIFAGEMLLLPCRPALLPAVTPAGARPSASPRVPATPDPLPQPGPLRVTLNPANAVVGAIIGVTIQDAGAREPLAVTVACGGQTMAAFSVTASTGGAATTSFSTTGYPAGRCRVDVARTVVSGGGSARLILTPAEAPPVQTPAPAPATQAAAAGTASVSPEATLTTPMDAPPATSFTPDSDAETSAPDAPPTDAENGEAAPAGQETPTSPPDAPIPATPIDAAPPPEEPPTAPPPSSLTSTLPPPTPAAPPPTAPIATSSPVPTAPPSTPTPDASEVGEPAPTQTAASP